MGILSLHLPSYHHRQLLPEQRCHPTCFSRTFSPLPPPAWPLPTPLRCLPNPMTSNKDSRSPTSSSAAPLAATGISTPPSPETARTTRVSPRQFTATAT